MKSFVIWGQLNKLGCRVENLGIEGIYFVSLKIAIAHFRQFVVANLPSLDRGWINCDCLVRLIHCCLMPFILLMH